MNIQMPKGVKSPTVVIVGAGTMNEGNNDKMHKRMDMMEKKLDHQYKMKMSNSSPDYSKVISSIQKSFEKVIASNKSIIKQMNSMPKIDSLRKDLRALKPDNSDKILKSFASKVDGLENAIKNIKVSSTTKIVKGDNSAMVKSFDKLLGQFQKSIQGLKPRMYPSPS